MHPVFIVTTSAVNESNFVRPRALTRGRQLGKGASGTATLVTDAHGRALVLKEIALTAGGSATDASAEARLLASCSHRHIVAFIDSWVDRRKLCLLMEYCRGGDLAAELARRRRTRAYLTEAHACGIAVHIASALEYLHTRRILHRDVKPANIFLSGGGGGGGDGGGASSGIGSGDEISVKLGDLGVARTLSDSASLAATQCGTPLFMSPQIFLGERYSSSSDMYALGCVLYECCALAPPFSGDGMQQLMAAVIAGRYPPLSPQLYSAGLRNAIDSLLSRDAGLRPTAAQLLALPVLQRARKADDAAARMAAPIAAAAASAPLPYPVAVASPGVAAKGSAVESVLTPHPPLTPPAAQGGAGLAALHRILRGASVTPATTSPPNPHPSTAAPARPRPAGAPRRDARLLSPRQPSATSRLDAVVAAPSPILPSSASPSLGVTTAAKGAAPRTTAEQAPARQQPAARPRFRRPPAAAAAAVAARDAHAAASIPVVVLVPAGGPRRPRPAAADLSSTLQLRPTITGSLSRQQLGLEDSPAGTATPGTSSTESTSPRSFHPPAPLTSTAGRDGDSSPSRTSSCGLGGTTRNNELCASEGGANRADAVRRAAADRRRAALSDREAALAAAAAEHRRDLRQRRGGEGPAATTMPPSFGELTAQLLPSVESLMREMEGLSSGGAGAVAAVVDCQQSPGLSCHSRQVPPFTHASSNEPLEFRQLPLRGNR